MSASVLAYYRVTRPAGATADLPLTDDRIQQLREQGWTVTPWSER